MIKGEGDKITGRQGPTPNRIAWKPMEGQLPMELVAQGSRVGGIIGLAVGIPWVYFSVGYLLDMIRLTGFSSGEIFLILLIAAGLFVILAGFSQFIYEEKTVIDRSSVFYRRTGLTGRREWREPLMKYRGILKEYQYSQTSGDRQADCMSYTLILDHEDATKSVRLYESQNTMMYPPEKWEKLWRMYGELFQLPLLEKTPDGVKSFSVEDLEKPLPERITEGKVYIPEMNIHNPDLPSCLSLHKEDDLWVITLKPARQLRDLIALFAMTCVLLVLGIVFQRHTANLFPIVMTWGGAGVLILSGVLAVISLARRFRHPDQLAVDADKVWYRRWDRRGNKWNTVDMPISGILRVELENIPTMQHRGERLIIASEHIRLECGEYLTGQGRRVLRNLFLYLISNRDVRK